MTINIDNTLAATFVAIDIAKHRHDVLVKHSDGTSASFKVANTLKDFRRFADYLRSLSKPIQIAFEPTADYHRNIAWFLLGEKYDIRLVSSVACARTREAVFNSRDKNDPKDAKVILHLMETGITQRYYDPLANGHHDLQELANTYSVTVYRRTQLLHSLKNHYLTLYFPEIEKYFNSTRSRWFMQTFHQFPTPASILALSEDQFIAAAWELVGKKNNKIQWLKDLYATADQSIGLPIEPNSIALEMYKTIIVEYTQITMLPDFLEQRANEVL